jgi:hypothetical protein
MVKRKDLTPTNPPQVQPNVGPVQLGPERPVEAVPTQGEQEQIIAQFEQETGQTFTPTTTPPKATLRQTPADTRSVRQQIADVSQTLASRQAPMGDGAYIKKNGQWSFIERSKFLDGVAPGSMKFIYRGEERNFGAQGLMEGGAILASAAANIIANPFKVLGGPAKKIKGGAENVADAIPYTEWLEDVVGSGVGGTAWLAQTFYNNSAKPFIRDVTIFASTPQQLIENLFFFGVASVNYLTPIGGREKYQPDASIWDQAKGVLTNTTLAQTIIAKGDVGEGFFVDAETEGKRNKLEESLRPELYGQTATFGRTLAAPMVATGIIEAGDDIHSLISGSIDVSAQVFLDPLNKLAAPIALRSLGEVPSALASPRQQRALVKAGVNLNPETLADAERIIEQLGEAGKLSDQAEALVTQRPGVFWSGDRYAAERGGPIEQFLDIDDPNFPVNNDNLAGPALYISDLSPLTTSYSSGRTGASDIIRLPGGEVRVPEISDVPNEAIVYEFRVPEKDFNVVNAELPWPSDPSLPYNFNAALEELGFSDNIFKQIESVLADNGIQAGPRDPFPFVGDSLIDQRRLLERPLDFLREQINFSLVPSGPINVQYQTTLSGLSKQQIKVLRKEAAPDVGFPFVQTRTNSKEILSEFDGKIQMSRVSETNISNSVEGFSQSVQASLNNIEETLRVVRDVTEKDVTKYNQRLDKLNLIKEKIFSAEKKLKQQKIIEKTQRFQEPFDRELFAEGLDELEDIYSQMNSFYFGLAEESIISAGQYNNLVVIVDNFSDALNVNLSGRLRLRKEINF